MKVKIDTFDAPAQRQIDDACMSYRHDFGLLSSIEKNKCRFQATEWLYAWRKAMIE